MFIILSTPSPNIFLLCILYVLYVMIIIFYRYIAIKYTNYSEDIFNRQIALELIEEYSKKIVNSKKYKKVLLNAKRNKQPKYLYPVLIINLNAFVSIVKLNYFKGNFSESVKFARTINFSELKIFEEYSITFKIFQYGFCIRSLLMLNQMEKSEILFEKMYELSFKNTKQKVEIDNALKLCQAIKDIVCLKKSNEFIDEWQPKFKVFHIEKLYFQAKNQELKGNATRAREIYKALSYDNPDLFFVREAKAYLEENK